MDASIGCFAQLLSAALKDKQLVRQDNVATVSNPRRGIACITDCSKPNFILKRSYDNNTNEDEAKEYMVKHIRMICSGLLQTEDWKRDCFER